MGVFSAFIIFFLKFSNVSDSFQNRIVTLHQKKHKTECQTLKI